MRQGIVFVLIIAIILFLLEQSRRGRSRRRRQVKTLVQCPIASLTPAILVQGQPVLIYDRLVDPGTDLPQKVFRWMHLPFARKRSRKAANSMCATRARYTLLWKPHSESPDADGSSSSSSRAQLRIADPSGKFDMDLLTSSGQVLVLPPRWRYVCATDALDTMELHDVASLCTRSLKTSP